MIKPKADITQQLMNYSLLATGLISTSIPTNGQVIYTDIDPDIILTEDEGWKYIDLDNDGLDDVGLQYTLWTTSSWSIALGDFNIDLIGVNRMGIVYGAPCTLYSSFNGMTCYIEMHSVADVFATGDHIGPANDWGQINRVKFGWECGPYGDGCSQGSFNNATGLPDEQFFAFKLFEPDLNYCWLRLYWLDDKLLLTGYACDTTGNSLEIIVPENTFIQWQNSANFQIQFIDNTLILHFPLACSDAVINIYDLLGQILYSTLFSGDDLSVPFNYSKGIYIIQVESPVIQFSQKIMLR